MTTVSTGTSFKVWGVLVAVTTTSSSTGCVSGVVWSARAVVGDPAIMVLSGRIMAEARNGAYLPPCPLPFKFSFIVTSLLWLIFICKEQ
jgi:hypothetical protein